MAQSSSSRRRNPQPRVLAGVSCVILSACLAGCVETAPTAEAPQPLVKPVAAKQPTGATPRGVSVALTSLTGVPEPIEAQMRDAFTAQAKERDIALGASQEPAYLIRGYVTSYPAEKGTAIAVVYDVFDGMKKRAQRIEDSVVVKGDGADPWSGFDAAAMNELAAKSADDLAAFLVATPEAMAARSSPATDTSASLASDSSRSQLSASANSPPSGLDDGQTIVQRARSTQSASAGDFSAAVLR